MNMQCETDSPRAGRGRALVAAAFLFTAAAGAASLYVTSENSPLHETNNPLDPASRLHPDAANGVDERRSLSVALPHGGCQVTYAKLSIQPIPPTWQASFPGSGSRMTWSLVEALTGIRTNDDYNSHDRGYERVVAVKTHYPVKDARRRFGELDQMFNRAMVILRNPINAVPSYFNLQYEHLNHLPNHSTRGPNEDWIKYRDDANSGLAIQLYNYENFVSYWMEKYPNRNQLLMLSYEDLTDNFTGPIVAARIASFLGEVDGVDPIAPESVPCVWETIVNYKNVAPPVKGEIRAVIKEAEGEAEVVLPDMPKDPAFLKLRRTMERRDEIRNERKAKKALKEEGGRRALQEEGGEEALAAEEEEIVLKKGKTHADPSSLRIGPKVRPYTEQNLADMLAMFHRLVEKFRYDEDFVRIMSAYIQTVQNTVPQND